MNDGNLDQIDDDFKYEQEEERRKVRAQYRKLTKIVEENAQEIINPESHKIGECLDNGEKLFSKVRRPREAVFDSAYILNLTKKSREQVQELKTDVVSFDNNTFMQKLISHVHGHKLSEDMVEDYVDLPVDCWKQLGKKAMELFRKTPDLEFLLGPLVIEVKQPDTRNRNVRRKEDHLIPTEKLKQIQNTDKQEESTTKEVERIYKVLRKKCNEGGRKNICFFSFIINPHSFGQTVENLFHFAFLIKDGRASVELDDNELPTISLHEPYREQEHKEIVARKQVVMPLAMKEWMELIEVYEIKESMIPTRESLN